MHISIPSRLADADLKISRDSGARLCLGEDQGASRFLDRVFVCLSAGLIEARPIAHWNRCSEELSQQVAGEDVRCEQ